jgi:phage terminase large subunit-like protein
MPLVLVVEFYKSLLADCPTEEDRRQKRRYLCLHDLFYLLTVECHRKDMVHPWVYDRCREVEEEPDEHLDLWAREHYKSTIITFGKTIQDILANPEITIGLFSHTKDNSQKFTKQIREELERNKNLKYLFPEVLWDNESQSPSWSDAELIVKRRGNPKEPTLKACGLLRGMPTGDHFDLLVYDDLVTETNVTSPEIIASTTDKLALSYDLGKETGKRRMVGTIYALGDTYSTVRERNTFKARVYPCTSDGSEDFTKAVLKDPVYLAKKRADQGVYVFGCQSLLNPVADKVMGFQEGWLQFWEAEHFANMRFLILCDPAGSLGKAKTDNDYTSFFVIGISGDRNYYVSYLLRDRMNLTGRWQMLLRLKRTFQPFFVGYEKIGLQSDIEHFEEEQKKINDRFQITPLGGIKSKVGRIQRLVPVFEQGRIYLPERHVEITSDRQAVDMVKEFINKEYVPFPIIKHDDMLDCLSRIMDKEVQEAIAANIPAEVKKSKWDAIDEVKRRGRYQHGERPYV